MEGLQLVGTISSLATAVFAGYGAYLLFLERRGKITAEFFHDVRKPLKSTDTPWEPQIEDIKYLDTIGIQVGVTNHTDRPIRIVGLRVWGAQMNRMSSYDGAVTSYKDGFQRPAGKDVLIGGKGMISMGIMPDWRKLDAQKPLVLRCSVIIDRNTRIASTISRTAKRIIPAEIIEKNAAKADQNSIGNSAS